MSTMDIEPGPDSVFPDGRTTEWSALDALDDTDDAFDDPEPLPRWTLPVPSLERARGSHAWLHGVDGGLGDPANDAIGDEPDAPAWGEEPTTGTRPILRGSSHDTVRCGPPDLCDEMLEVG